jgi:biopolymer transport protein ExbD/biopolymer transport protein TolR
MGMDVGSGGGKKRRVVPSMNVTPLVDVVLVLLIIFMVITPMLVKQFWTHVPKRDDAKAEEAAGAGDAQAPVVLSVRRDGTIRINKDSVSLTELPARLERIFAARGDHLVFFDADDDLPYARAMEVMDAARGGGAAHIAVLTEPLEE